LSEVSTGILYLYKPVLSISKGSTGLSKFNVVETKPNLDTPANAIKVSEHSKCRFIGY